MRLARAVFTIAVWLLTAVPANAQSGNSGEANFLGLDIFGGYAHLATPREEGAAKTDWGAAGSVRPFDSYPGWVSLVRSRARAPAMTRTPGNISGV